MMLPSRTFPTFLVVMCVIVNFQGCVEPNGPAPCIHFKRRTSRFIEPELELRKHILVAKTTGESVVSTCTIGYNASQTTFKTFEVERNVSYPPGNNTKPINITIKRDGKLADNLTVVLSIISCSAGTHISSPSVHTIFVSNRDAMIQFQDLHLKGMEGGPAIHVIIERKGWLGRADQFRLTANPSGQLDLNPDHNYTFNQNDAMINISVSVIKDNVIEREAVNVTMTLGLVGSPGNLLVNLSRHVATVTVQDNINDETAYIQCLNTTLQVVERAKRFSIMVKKKGLLHINTSFWVQTVDGSAFAKADYKPITKQTYTFQSGMKYLTFDVEIIDDVDKEDDETFSITLGAYPPYPPNYPTVVATKHCSSVVIKDGDSEGATKEQTEDLLKKKQLIIVLLSVGVALLCLIVIVLVVLMYCVAK